MIPRIEEIPDEDAAPQIPTVSISNSQPIIPEHPYWNARDAAYSPPVNRNIGAQDKSNPIKRAEPAYKTLPPVHDPAIATQVYKRSMDTPITITQRELLSLSPEVRSQVRDVTTTKRIHRDGNNTAQNYLEEENNYDVQRLLQTVVEGQPAIAIDQIQPDTPPHGSLITTDPVEVYYKSLREGETPDPSWLIVAMESGAIRSITALIDNRQKRECILDPGCQIITMSEQVCHDIGLAYNPSIVLSMQSANGNVDPSLGLAQNIPFHIGPITAIYKCILSNCQPTMSYSADLSTYLHKASSETSLMRTRPLLYPTQTQDSASQYRPSIGHKNIGIKRIFSGRRVN